MRVVRRAVAVKIHWGSRRASYCAVLRRGRDCARRAFPGWEASIGDLLCGSRMNAESRFTKRAWSRPLASMPPLRGSRSAEREGLPEAGFPGGGGFNAAAASRPLMPQSAQTLGASSASARFVASPAARAALAEREGFEPPVPLRVLLFSRQTRSTTLAPLRDFLLAT